MPWLYSTLSLQCIQGSIFQGLARRKCCLAFHGSEARCSHHSSGCVCIQHIASLNRSLLLQHLLRLASCIQRGCCCLMVAVLLLLLSGPLAQQVVRTSCKTQHQPKHCHICRVLASLFTQICNSSAQQAVQQQNASGNERDVCDVCLHCTLGSAQGQT